MKSDPIAIQAATEPIVGDLLAIAAEEPDSCIMTDLSAEGGQPMGISFSATALDLSIHLDEDATDRQRDQVEAAGFGEDGAEDGALVKHWDVAPGRLEEVLREAIPLGLTILNEVFYDEIEQISIAWDGYVIMPMSGATSA